MIAKKNIKTLLVSYSFNIKFCCHFPLDLNLCVSIAKEAGGVVVESGQGERNVIYQSKIPGEVISTASFIEDEEQETENQADEHSQDDTCEQGKFWASIFLYIILRLLWNCSITQFPLLLCSNRATKQSVGQTYC